MSFRYFTKPKKKSMRKPEEKQKFTWKDIAEYYRGKTNNRFGKFLEEAEKNPGFERPDLPSIDYQKLETT